MTETATLELSREAITQQLEAGARHRLKMSAAEMISLYKKGELNEPSSVADLLGLAALLPEEDPLHVEL